MHGWNHISDEDRKAVQEGIIQGRPLGGPYHIELDPADICNAGCFFCNSASFRKGDVLDWPLLYKRINELIQGGLRSIRLAGGGEPLLYPHLSPLCDKLRGSKIILENLTTNGILLDNNIIDLFLPLGPTHFFISLNYADENQYEKFMGIPGRQFSRVLDNIRILDQKLVKAGIRPSAQIHIQFFIHHSTIRDITRMIELSLSLPVDTVTLRAINHLCPEEHLAPQDIKTVSEHLTFAAEKCRNRMWLIFDLAPYGMGEVCDTIVKDLYREHRSKELPRPPGIEYCYIGWYSMTIRGNGDVFPCCWLMPDGKIPPLGNINKETIHEIWCGRNFLRFRQEMRSAMIIQDKPPFQARLSRFTLPLCREHDACPMASQMADTPFYIKVHEQLEKIRHKPLHKISRWYACVSRKIIRSMKRIP